MIRSIKTFCNCKLTCVVEILVGVAKMNVEEVVSDADIVVVVGAAVAAVVCAVGMAVDASGEPPAVWPTSLGVVWTLLKAVGITVLFTAVVGS